MNNVVINLKLKSHVVKTLPHIQISVDNDLLVDKNICKGNHSINLDCMLEPGKHTLYVCFLNKNYDEITCSDDMAVEIEHVGFQNLSYNLNYLSFYKPRYPSDWLQQQKSNGQNWADTLHSNYLGWNGSWQVAFETPIYRWIHKTVNLGWLI